MSIELEPIPALVVIDLQSGIVAIPCAHPMEQVIANSARLAGAFRDRNLPVVLVNVDSTSPGRTERSKLAGRVGAQALAPEDTVLVPELNVQPGDIRVTKQTAGAFSSTGLDARLRAVGATQLILTGVSTTSGVESTARSGFELGFHIAFVIDAMTDPSLEAHEASITHQFPKFGEIGTTAELLVSLAR